MGSPRKKITICVRQSLTCRMEKNKRRDKMDVQPGSASASNLKIDQSESRKLSVFSNLTRKQSTAIGAKKKRITKEPNVRAVKTRLECRATEIQQYPRLW